MAERPRYILDASVAVRWYLGRPPYADEPFAMFRDFRRHWWGLSPSGIISLAHRIMVLDNESDNQASREGVYEMAGSGPEIKLPPIERASARELARRRRVVNRILELRRKIGPTGVPADELVREARQEAARG